MLPTKNDFVTAAKGEDLADLLDHIAWTDVVAPKLAEAKDALTKMLVAATLGSPVVMNGPRGTAQREVTVEQLAGKIWAIDWISTEFTKILREGDRAKERLRETGFSL